MVESILVARMEPRTEGMSRSKHRFSFKDRRIPFEVDTKYIPIQLIGKGAYGLVCSAINLETNNEKVAIKKITNVFENRIDALRVLRELIILRHLRHENVIALKDVMVSSHRRSSFKDVYLVYELMDSDLHRIINKSPHFTKHHCQFFLLQLLRGLKYLHSMNILHRDLKPGNLLVSNNYELKICDFGLARAAKGEGQFMTDYVVTRWYRAPELLLGCDYYGPSIDMWSVGCIFAEMLGRAPIFPGTDPLDQLKLIISVLGTFDCDSDLEFIKNPRAKEFLNSLPFSRGCYFDHLYPKADPLAIDLLKRMLVFDPTKRITVGEALEHPYMSGLCDPWESLPARLPFHLDVDEKLEVPMIRELMWKEMCYFHPEAAYFHV